jgi:endonuclease/exonuclease/phosphatase family metal-dependent hydrolase
MLRALSLALLLATPALADPVQLKVLTFNIWYGGDQVSFASVIKAIQLADADVVGLQEPDGKTLEIAALAGYPYADQRRHIISKYPIFDSALGETTRPEAPLYSIAGLDPDAVHAWIEVRPGKVVAMANTHLTSDPYGPELARDGKTVDEIVANENEARLPEGRALIDGLKPLVDAKVPVILTGDFNSPSWRDWQGRPVPVVWPVSKAMEDAGLTDSFRAVHPDPATDPGLTWTAGRPWPYVPPGETMDRIDFIWSANMRPTASVVMGEAGNPQNGLSVMPWPSDHRAVLSTFEVEPIDAPSLITVEPRPVRQGGSFVLRITGLNGGTYSAMVTARGGTEPLIGIADVDPADRPTLRLSTLGLPPGDYDAVLSGVDGAGELARTRFAIIPADGQATLTVTAPVHPGSDIPLAFSGSQGFKLDWVGIYRKGEPSVYNYLGFAYTGARINGSLTFPAGELYEELTSGDYEARLMWDDHYRMLAVAHFAVTAP